MNIFAVSGLINAISVSILGAFVYLKNRTSKINKKYALFCFFVAFWSYNYFLWQIAKEAKIALFFCRSLMAGAIFIPICFLHFVLILLNLVEQKKKILNLGYFIFSIFFILNFTSYFVKDVSPKLFFPFWPEAGITFGPFLAIWLWYCLYPCLLLYKGFRRSSGVKRNQLKYVLWGIVIGYSSGSTNYFLWFDIPIAPYGNFFVPLFVGIMSYAIVQYRLMDINIVITRGIAYGGIAAVFTGAYIGILFWLDKVFSKFPGYNYILISSLLFILFLFIFIFILPRIKIRAVDMVKDSLFPGKYDYQRQLEEISKAIPSKLDLKDLTEYALGRIKEAIGVEKLSLSVLDEVAHQYTICSSLGLDKKNLAKIKIGENSGLASLLREVPQPLVKEELEKISSLTEEAKDMILKQVKCLEAETCIPLMVKDNLIGILALGSKKSGEMYNDEDLSLLSTLASQLALTIEYIKAIDKITSEKRFVSLGKASLRMAHDIRNPLVSIKTCLQLLPIKYPELFEKMREKDAEYTDVLYQTATHDVDRITYLIERALDYARHPEPVFSSIDLHSAIDEALATMQPTLQMSNIEVIKKYHPQLDRIEADSEQLTEVFTNLFSNASHAMEKQATKKLTVTTEEADNSVYITVADTGCGISEKNIADIFDPFITYTHEGSGLGLAIVKKVIEDHHGTITVSSAVGEGTTFRINLPKQQVAFKKEKGT